MAVLYYMPAPGDPKETSVADGRLKFQAYQLTLIDQSNPIDEGLFQKLKANPWFAETIDEARRQKWVDSLTT
jgi:hypothetical protein